MSKFRVALGEKELNLTVFPVTENDKPDGLTIADIDGETATEALQQFISDGRALTRLRELEEKAQTTAKARMILMLQNSERPGMISGFMAASGQGLHWTQRKVDILKSLLG